MRRFSIFLLAIVLANGFLPGLTWAQATAPDSHKTEVEALIQARSAELEKINQQLQATQQNLESTKSERASLQRQVNSLVQTIKQLELSAQADEVKSQKLGLEIDSLNYDIHDIELSVANKKQTVANVLRELQMHEQMNPVVMFLKNKSISETFRQSQSLEQMRAQLSSDIANLFDLQKDLTTKAKFVNEKKSEIQFHQKNTLVKKSLIQDQQEEQKIILAQTKNKETLYQQQVNELKKQQDAIEDELAKLEDQLKANFNNGLLPTSRHGILDYPIKLASDGGIGRLTQHYGERSSLYRGKPHNGMDIGAPVGTPVYAAADGVVMAVDNNDRSRTGKYQYGRYILIRHPNNLATIYAHLSQQVVSRGQEVKQGDLIGYSGNTGYSTGPHLHFGAYWAPSIELKAIPPAAGLVPVGVTVAPENYL